MADDKNRLRKTYSFFRQQPVYATGGGGGGGGGTTDQFWYSTTPGSIYTTGSVAIRGGSSGVDAPSDLGADVFFYVSGSIDAKSTNYTNISLFGGDVVVSGSLKSLTAFSGSLTKLVDGTSYIIAGSGVSISTGSTGAITISSAAIPGGSITQVQFNDGGTFGGDPGLTYNKTTDTLTGVNVVLSGDLTVNGTMTTVNTNNLEVKDAIIGLGFASGSVGQSGNDRGLILGLGNSPHAAFLWKHSESEFVVGSTTSSATGSLPITLSSYSNFHANDILGSTITASLGFSGSLTRLANGASYLVAGNNITISSASNGQVTIASAVTPVSQFFSSTTAGSIFTTGSIAFIDGEAGIDSPSDKGTNVFFYVSGSISGSGSGDKRVLFGGDVVISGSLRQGLQTNASGLYSHAEGSNTTASGGSSHAEGANTTASGVYSHAEGLTTTASAIASHAEGQFTVASGWYSHAEGASTTASGIGSHAEGNSTEAVGTYSLAAGIGTIASGTAQNVFGKYNLRNNASSLFIIGDGTASLDASRGDILRVNAGPSIGRGRFDVTGTISANIGLSGSLTRLTDGTSYLIAGSNVTITSASNGSVTISSSGTGGGGGDPDASYVVLSATGSLSSERVLSTGTGLFLSDAGAGANVTLSVNDSVVATISGSTFTGTVKFDQGLSGSLTRLVDGSSYLVAGTNVTISSASNGQVTISSSGGGTPAGSDTEVQFNNAGSFGASANLNFNSSTNTLSLTGSFGMKGDIIPDADTTYNLGTSDKRWANVYTGDLHLRNDRGDWTIVEERDYLCVVNNITGKKYKMMLQPLDNE